MEEVEEDWSGVKLGGGGERYGLLIVDHPSPTLSHRPYSSSLPSATKPGPDGMSGLRDSSKLASPSTRGPARMVSWNEGEGSGTVLG